MVFFFLLWFLCDSTVEAMHMCHEQDPQKRASARQVETFLKEKIRRLLPGKLEEWGIHS